MNVHTRSGKGCFSTYPRLLTLPSFMAPELAKTQFRVLWSRAPIFSKRCKLTSARSEGSMAGMVRDALVETISRGDKQSRRGRCGNILSLIGWAERRKYVVLYSYAWYPSSARFRYFYIKKIKCRKYKKKDMQATRLELARLSSVGLESTALTTRPHLLTCKI